MQKFFKRQSKVIATVMALVLMLSLSVQPAFAAEADTDVPEYVVENAIYEGTTDSAHGSIPANAKVETFEVTLEPGESFCTAIPGTGSDVAPASYYPPESFTFQGVRRGADHHMDGNYMAYEVVITMEDGSTEDIPVLIQVRTYINIVLSSWREFPADGVMHKVDWIPFPGGGDCYFEYANTCSGWACGPVTITLTCYSWE